MGLTFLQTIMVIQLFVEIDIGEHRWRQNYGKTPQHRPENNLKIAQPENFVFETS